MKAISFIPVATKKLFLSKHDFTRARNGFAFIPLLPYFTSHASEETKSIVRHEMSDVLALLDQPASAGLLSRRLRGIEKIVNTQSVECDLVLFTTDDCRPAEARLYAPRTSHIKVEEHPPVYTDGGDTIRFTSLFAIRAIGGGTVKIEKFGSVVLNTENLYPFRQPPLGRYFPPSIVFEDESSLKFFKEKRSL